MTASIKASSIRQALDFVKERYGDAGLERVLEGMDSSAVGEIRSILLPIAWKPEAAFIDLLKAIDGTFGTGDFSLCREVGFYSAQAGLNTFFKAFIRLGDPKYVLKTASKFWSSIHNHGRLETEEAGPGRAVARVYDYETPHRAFCQNLMGYCQGVLEISGAKNVSIRETKCFNDGAACCEFEAAWD